MPTLSTQEGLPYGAKPQRMSERNVSGSILLNEMQLRARISKNETLQVKLLLLISVFPVNFPLQPEEIIGYM